MAHLTGTLPGRHLPECRRSSEHAAAYSPRMGGRRPTRIQRATDRRRTGSGRGAPCLPIAETWRGRTRIRYRRTTAARAAICAAPAGPVTETSGKRTAPGAGAEPGWCRSTAFEADLNRSGRSPFPVGVLGRCCGRIRTFANVINSHVLSLLSYTTLVRGPTSREVHTTGDPRAPDRIHEPVPLPIDLDFRALLTPRVGAARRIRPASGRKKPRSDRRPAGASRRGHAIDARPGWIRTVSAGAVVLREGTRARRGHDARPCR